MLLLHVLCTFHRNHRFEQCKCCAVQPTSSMALNAASGRLPSQSETSAAQEITANTRGLCADYQAMQLACSAAWCWCIAGVPCMSSNRKAVHVHGRAARCSAAQLKPAAALHPTSVHTLLISLLHCPSPRSVAGDEACPWAVICPLSGRWFQVVPSAEDASTKICSSAFCRINLTCYVCMKLSHEVVFLDDELAEQSHRMP